VIKYYPQSSQAGNASFYLGEIAYRQGLYPAAIKNYDVVLTQYPASGKAPAAQLRKGEAELAASQKEAGIRDLRMLVRRYPVTPEGAQARSLLNGMGVRLSARKPSPYDAQ
jgi:TolA-binding protein